MFRVFLFSSHKEFNWLILKSLCSGYFMLYFDFTLVSRTFRKLGFLQCSPYCFCTAYTAYALQTEYVWTWCKRPISHTAHEIRLVLCASYCNKNPVHDQTFRRYKYIFLKKRKQKCPPLPFKLKILSHKSYLEGEFFKKNDIQALNKCPKSWFDHSYK